MNLASEYDNDRSNEASGRGQKEGGRRGVCEQQARHSIVGLEWRALGLNCAQSEHLT